MKMNVALGTLATDLTFQREALTEELTAYRAQCRQNGDYAAYESKRDKIEAQKSALNAQVGELLCQMKMSA